MLLSGFVGWLVFFFFCGLVCLFICFRREVMSMFPLPFICFFFILRNRTMEHKSREYRKKEKKERKSIIKGWLS